MIIRDEIEILEDIRLVLASSIQANDKKFEKRKKIEDAFALFGHFHLNSRSKTELEKYFRYLLRNLKEDEKIQYNFFVHSNDNLEAESFVRTLVKAIHLLGSDKESDIIISESTLLSSGKVILETMKKSSTFAVHSCLPMKAYALGGTRNKDEKDSVWRAFLRLCADSPGTCKIICASDLVSTERFRSNEHLYFRVFQHHIYLQEMTAEELLDIVANQIRSRGFTVTEGFNADLEEYLAVVYPKADLRNYSFADDLVNRILSTYYGSDWEDSIITEDFLPFYHKEINYRTKLDRLIGLDEVKEKIEELDKYMQFYKKSAENGLNLGNINLHMLFMGNPGTGKTTVARIVAEILYTIGIIRKNKVVEVERKDLVAEYIGHTAVKTAAVIERAMGGVLFIDEAYSLAVKDNSRDFGREAIETLITAMENNKGEFVVIFAGYRDEMQQFIDSNPGISSRIGYQFLFRDYSTEELMQLYKIKLRERGFVCEDSEALEKVNFLLKYYGGVKNAGNGRFVGNVIQGITLKHAKRITSLYEPSEDDFRTITAEDIPDSDELSHLFGGHVMAKKFEDIEEQDKRRIAVHELGHALAAYITCGNSNIKSISILPQADGSLGRVVHIVSQSILTTEEEIFNSIIISLAGRSAEKAVFGNQSVGCASDYEKAKIYAENMINRYHMVEYGNSSMEILENADTRAMELIEQNLEMLHSFVDILMERREIQGEEVDGFFSTFLKNQAASREDENDGD